jgi:hypothetical protein
MLKLRRLEEKLDAQALAAKPEVAAPAKPAVPPRRIA